MIIVVLGLLGLCMGSFVNALVWRLHENKKEISIFKGRSMCPNCRHALAAKDLIPVFSWLTLAGKCRYCTRPISKTYPLIEIITAILFVVSYFFWPTEFGVQGTVLFVIWLVLLTGFVALAFYDIKWFILPNSLIYPLLVLAILTVLYLTVDNFSFEPIKDALFGVLIGGGIFYALFQISGGKWIGGGDVKLGALSGILLGGPLRSFLMLFIASVLGTLASLPLVAAGKAKRSTRLPFGPFLIVATVIVYLFGESLVAWYKKHILQV